MTKNPALLSLAEPRYVLADGSCVIDIFHKGGTISDTGNFSQIRDATFAILAECVQESQTWSGGYARYLGDLKNLVVVVSKFMPSVTCGGTVRPLPSVRQALLDTIPTQWTPEIFGRPGDSGVGVVVPKTFSIPPVPGEWYHSTHANIPFETFQGL